MMVETATVYRSRNGRRYFTAKACLRKNVWHLLAMRGLEEEDRLDPAIHAIVNRYVRRYSSRAINRRDAA